MTLTGESEKTLYLESKPALLKLVQSQPLKIL